MSCKIITLANTPRLLLQEQAPEQAHVEGLRWRVAGAQGMYAAPELPVLTPGLLLRVRQLLPPAQQYADSLEPMAERSEGE